MEISKIIIIIKEMWFLSEPLLFAVLCTHNIVENLHMPCAIRSGKMLIEYNPDVLGDVGKEGLETLLRREVIRVLFKHPYQRMPLRPIPEILILASNITIYQHGRIGTDLEKKFSGILPANLSFEEYYNILIHDFEDSDPNEDNENDDDDGCQSKDDRERAPKEKGETELWEENEIEANRIDNLIEQAMVSRQWGSLSGDIRELLKASLQKSLNIRRQLALFKTSILSTQRRLTRMRPSRRYGWTQMGVVHPYTTRLLVSVDISGSVLSDDISRFFSVINSFFTYGIPIIDVLQFDSEIKLPLLKLHRITSSIEITGRGGTNFQAPVDYFNVHKEYDGMIVFTDGYADTPVIPTRRRILWVLKDISCYNVCKLTPKIYI